jgi:uncharacterized protein (DUF1330 family)
MPAYVVVNVEVTNPIGYQEYVRQVEPSIQAYGGRYLVRAGRTEVLEGDFVPRRFVVVEFSDAARARSWWDSSEYAAAKKLRQAHARTDMFIVDGA